MKKFLILSLVAIFALSSPIESFAQQRGATDILRSGLLGAGAGALGGAASGADGDDWWKGALAGAGVNIIGGALLDVIGGGSTQPARRVIRTQPGRTYYNNNRQYYSPPKQVQEQAYYVKQLDAKEIYNLGYQEGYKAGYKAGYDEGYKEGLREGLWGD